MPPRFCHYEHEKRKRKKKKKGALSKNKDLNGPGKPVRDSHNQSQSYGCLLWQYIIFNEKLITEAQTCRIFFDFYMAPQLDFLVTRWSPDQDSDSDDDDSDDMKAYQRSWRSRNATWNLEDYSLMFDQ